MPKVPGINQLAAIRALEKAGFHIRLQGKHVVMTDGTRIVTIPRHNPDNAITMGTNVRGAGHTNDEFRKLLSLAVCISHKTDFRDVTSTKRQVQTGHSGNRQRHTT